MDGTSSMPTSKSPKLSTGHNVGRGKDIISNLPDEIRHHIISFLPIKDIVKTFILSKTWQYLSTIISSIDFDDGSLDCWKKCGPGNSFLDTVDRALLLDDASYLRKFRLYMNMGVSSSHVNSWVSIAIKHKVHELDLSLPVRTRFVMPHSLFTSESLSILKLEMDCALEVPSSICFSGLKTLRLALVTFQGEQTTLKFFSGCPVLEELVLYNCVWENIRSITIYTPTLRALTIYCDSPSPGDLLNCEIKIYAVNLKSLRCTSYMIFEFVLCGLSSLVDAYIEVESWGDMQQTTHRIIELIGGIHSVKSLTLSNDTLEFLHFVENLQDHLPTYHNLTYLEVNMGYSDYTKTALLHFLQKSPNLESFHIPEGFDPETFIIEKERILKFVPHCFKSCLKTFSISNFVGIAAEMHLLEYLVENAIVLERISISCLENLSQDLEKQKIINHQLQLRRRGLTSCVIEFL